MCYLRLSEPPAGNVTALVNFVLYMIVCGVCIISVRIFVIRIR